MSSQDTAADQAAGGRAAEPPSFDISIAHPARVYDYLLGGKDNYEADRAAAEEMIAMSPEVLPTVRSNRAFLRRAVEYLVGEAGIRQFLDIGTGLPTAENTHQLAQAIAPDCRVVYVDNDHCKSGCTHTCAAGERWTFTRLDLRTALQQPVSVTKITRQLSVAPYYRSLQVGATGWDWLGLESRPPLERFSSGDLASRHVTSREP